MLLGHAAGPTASGGKQSLEAKKRELVRALLDGRFCEAGTTEAVGYREGRGWGDLMAW